MYEVQTEPVLSGPPDAHEDTALSAALLASDQILG